MPEHLFFALWLAENTQERIAEIQQRAYKWLGHGKPVPTVNFHLTLAFLGKVSPTQRAAIAEAAKQVKSSSFSLNLEKIGYWEQSGVLWLAPEKTPLLLTDLVKALQQVLQPSGYVPDKRPYRPHVTLLRDVKYLNDGLPRFSFNPLTEYFQHFCLVRSILIPNGSKYEVIQHYPL